MKSNKTKACTWLALVIASISILVVSVIAGMAIIDLMAGVI